MRVDNYETVVQTADRDLHVSLGKRPDFTKYLGWEYQSTLIVL